MLSPITQEHSDTKSRSLEVLARAKISEPTIGPWTPAFAGVNGSVVVLAMNYHLFLAFLLITLVLVILRWAGAANLIWLGIQSWRTAGRAAEASGPRAPPSPCTHHEKLPPHGSAGSTNCAPPRHRVHISRGFLVAIGRPGRLRRVSAAPQCIARPALRRRADRGRPGLSWARRAA